MCTWALERERERENPVSKGYTWDMYRPNRLKSHLAIEITYYSEKYVFLEMEKKYPVVLVSAR